MLKNKPFILVLLLTLHIFTVFGYPGTLSDKASISIITILPGSEIHTLFGHTAIRIKDTASGLDEVYNYGTFDFKDPKFIIKFLNGSLNYFLDRDRFSRSLWYYINVEKRTVIEQQLNLTLSEKEQIYQFLIHNHRPENKYYRYDFLLDNCTTRVRDIFNRYLNQKIQYLNSRSDSKTFREEISEYLGNDPFLDFSFALLLGPEADRVPSPLERHYFPIPLMEGFDLAQLSNQDTPAPMVLKKKVIYKRSVNTDERILITPSLLIWTLFLISLIVSFPSGLIKSKFLPRICSLGRKIFDLILFFALGAYGSLIIFLWFFSRHHICNGNLNLLFLIPTHLAASIFTLFSVFKKIKEKYFSLSFGLLGIYILTCFFSNQFFHPAFTPLILMTGLRTFFLSGFKDRIKLFRKF